MKGWNEQFWNLFPNPTVINRVVMYNLPKKDIIHEILDH